MEVEETVIEYFIGSKNFQNIPRNSDESGSSKFSFLTTMWKDTFLQRKLIEQNCERNIQNTIKLSEVFCLSLLFIPTSRLDFLLVFCFPYFLTFLATKSTRGSIELLTLSRSFIRHTELPPPGYSFTLSYRNSLVNRQELHKQRT